MSNKINPIDRELSTGTRSVDPDLSSEIFIARLKHVAEQVSSGDITLPESLVLAYVLAMEDANTYYNERILEDVSDERGGASLWDDGYGWSDLQERFGNLAKTTGRSSISSFSIELTCSQENKITVILGTPDLPGYPRSLSVGTFDTEQEAFCKTVESIENAELTIKELIRGRKDSWQHILDELLNSDEISIRSHCDFNNKNVWGWMLEIEINPYRQSYFWPDDEARPASCNTNPSFNLKAEELILAHLEMLKSNLRDKNE